MANIILRQANAVISPGSTVKGSPLSNSEVDNNFSNINIVVGFSGDLTTTANANLVVAINELKNSLDNLSQASISNGTSNVNITVADGPIEVSANLLPLTANIFDLGSPTKRFRDLYLTGNSLDLDGTIVSSDGANLLLNGNVVISATGGFLGNLTNTGAAAGFYGSSSTVARINIGTDGRIIEASNVEIVGGAIVEDITNVDLDSFFPVMANTQVSGNLANAIVSSTKLFFNTQTGVFNATDFNSLSDATLKTNFQPITNASDILKMISGIEFNWKDNNRKSAGVLAQEVQSILPHVVTESSSGLKSVNYGSLTAYLIQSVKELTARIEDLEKKNGS